MANANMVILIGRLTRDPELRYTQGGAAVTEFGFAVNRKWKTGTGDEREETMFIQVVAWTKLAEVLCQYLKKGSSAYISGRLQLDQWDDRESGAKRSQHKVVAETVQFLDRKGDTPQRDDPRQSVPAPAPAPEPPPPPPPPGAAGEFELDEEVPF